ncbi:MAG: DUF2459 domain-containing protein [Vicingaceae bacterium]
MAIFKFTIRLFVSILTLPIFYVLIALLASLIPVNKDSQVNKSDQQIYLSTNGVHLYIILEKEDIASSLLNGLDYDNSFNYFSFGWGDKNFYLNTPEWSDLTIKNAVHALFLNTPTLMHFVPYKVKDEKWNEIPITETQLNKLNNYILKSFKLDQSGKKIKLPFEGYTNRDSFYEAEGKYNCFKTSNSWVNEAFKKSGLKACLWTPFDFILIEKHKGRY